MSEELKPCPFCGCEADFDEDSGDGVTCAKTEGSCGFYFNNDGGWTRKEVAALWNRRASPEPDLTVGPEPAPGDRESQGAFIDDPIREGPPMDLFKRACDWIENIDIQYGPSPHSLAAEFAKVREEQKEMDAKIADGMIDRNDAGKIDHDDIGSITALDIRDAIRRGEP